MESEQALDAAYVVPAFFIRSSRETSSNKMAWLIEREAARVRAIRGIYHSYIESHSTKR